MLEGVCMYKCMCGSKSAYPVVTTEVQVDVFFYDAILLAPVIHNIIFVRDVNTSHVLPEISFYGIKWGFVHHTFRIRLIIRVVLSCAVHIAS